jgi:pyruvate/2-oxoglutarate dehydrogenase complex dihydrolipoamide dehydrogenase (E3) component
MKFNYHIIVIGAGSGGLVVASGGASLGAKIALIEDDSMGGDCLNAGCVPSKSFLRCAHLAADIRDSNLYGLSATLGTVDAVAVMKRVHDVILTIAPHDSAERYTSMGVDVIRERGILVDKHTVKIQNRIITGKYLVIATGSEPAVPPIPGLKDVPYLTNRNIFNIKTLPKKLIILGGGPVGLELGQGFRHLGSDVEIVDVAPHLFPKDDHEVAPLMERILRDEGITLTLSTNIAEVTTNGDGITVVVDTNGKKREISGDRLLVSLGRKPVTGNMGLENAGVKLDDRGYIEVNSHLQTTTKNIYACGDVTGPYQFTHMAGYQAGVVLRNIIFPLFKARVDYSAVPWTTFMRPEVAHVGYTETDARAKGIYIDSIRINLEDIDRARTENDTTGFLKIIFGKGNRIIGATMVGNKAGEIIPLASVAIHNRMKVTAFMSLIFSYPTEAEIFKFAGLAYAKKSLKPWMTKLIQRILLR